MRDCRVILNHQNAHRTGLALVSVRKPAIEIIGFLSRRRLHLERSPSGTRHCSQPENADFLSEMFPDRHLGRQRPATRGWPFVQAFHLTLAGIPAQAYGSHWINEAAKNVR